MRARMKNWLAITMIFASDSIRSLRTPQQRLVENPAQSFALEYIHTPPPSMSANMLEHFTNNFYFFASTGPAAAEEKDEESEVCRFSTESPGASASYFAYTVRISFHGERTISWFTLVIGKEDFSLPVIYDKIATWSVRILDDARGVERDATSAVGAVPRFVVETTAKDIGTLIFEAVEAMHVWRVSYRGLLVATSNRTTYHCDASFLVRLNPGASSTFFFTGGGDWSSTSIGRALAEASWTQTFWTLLFVQRQERYSTPGIVSGAVTLASSTDQDGRDDRRRRPSVATPVWSRVFVPIEVDAEGNEAAKESGVDSALYGSRDRNFGIRDWNFIWRYVWWPPLRFDRPIEIDGAQYRYFTGTFVATRGTFPNLVTGALLPNRGDLSTRSLSIAAATPIRSIAPRWYGQSGSDDEDDERNACGARACDADDDATFSHGGRYVPADMHYQIVVELSDGFTCDLNIHVQRGAPRQLWHHAFYFANGTFEVHEAISRFAVQVVEDPKSDRCGRGRVRGKGLLEFGANLVGHVPVWS